VRTCPSLRPCLPRASYFIGTNRKWVYSHAGAEIAAGVGHCRDGPVGDGFERHADHRRCQEGQHRNGPTVDGAVLRRWPGRVADDPLNV
jgi:hypothetical protein